jgi:hypothetical protein
MGWNTTMLILNDHLSSIENDSDFGKRVASGVRQMGGSPTTPIEIRGGLLIESHHADHCVPILVGGNYGWLVEKCFVRWSSSDPEKQLLEALAKKHGFDLTPKKK